MEKRKTIQRKGHFRTSKNLSTDQHFKFVFSKPDSIGYHLCSQQKTMQIFYCVKFQVCAFSIELQLNSFQSESNEQQNTHEMHEINNHQYIDCVSIDRRRKKMRTDIVANPWQFTQHTLMQSYRFAFSMQSLRMSFSSAYCSRMCQQCYRIPLSYYFHDTFFWQSDFCHVFQSADHAHRFLSNLKIEFSGKYMIQGKMERMNQSNVIEDAIHIILRNAALSRNKRSLHQALEVENAIWSISNDFLMNVPELQ